MVLYAGGAKPSKGSSGGESSGGGSVTIPEDVMYKSKAETISGKKTFLVSPVVPTATEDSNDTTASNTEWINNRINSSDVSSYMSGVVAPSSRREDLTLAATGTSYTAPANGWFSLNKKSGEAGQTIYLSSNGTQQGMRAYKSGNECCASVYVKKGQKVTVDYFCTGDTKSFRFVYADGEN